MSYINDEKVTYFAETDFRGNKTRFGIKGKDRTKHMYILGKTGMGKSTMLGKHGYSRHTK
jgi:type IV secretory pathway VirB4 component